jgi:ribosomal protein S18 acetylase RimI-like enzyme
MMKFKIRPAHAGDYKGICRLCETVDALHRRNLPHVFRKPDGPARELPYIQRLLDSPDVAFLVAEQEGGLAGFVVVMLEHTAKIPLFVPRLYAVIDNLVVDTRYRRRGLGRALMVQAENWASTRGATEVTLNVFEFNQAAQKMYQALGYQTRSRKMAKRLDRQ